MRIELHLRGVQGLQCCMIHFRTQSFWRQAIRTPLEPPVNVNQCLAMADLGEGEGLNWRIWGSVAVPA